MDADYQIYSYFLFRWRCNIVKHEHDLWDSAIIRHWPGVYLFCTWKPVVSIFDITNEEFNEEKKNDMKKADEKRKKERNYINSGKEIL